MPNERKLFWHNLEQIKNGLDQNDIEFARFIGISFQQYAKCRNTITFLPLAHVYDLAEKLNFHFSDLVDPDFKLVISGVHSKEQKEIPEKYSRALYSKLTPTSNIINYLEKTRGARAKVNLLRKFQLTENFLNDENSRTNIHLISDVVQYLAQTYEFSEKEFINMGKQTPYSAAGQLIKNELGGHTKTEDLLEVFIIDCAKYFDKNCAYRLLEIKNDFAIMEALPNVDVMEELKIKSNQFGNEEVCLTKMGCISSFTWFNFNRYARVEKLTSVYEGDATNQYLIDLAPFKKLSSSSLADVLQFKPIHH